MPLVISGAVSGSTTLQATDAVTATITLPSATDTLVGKTTPSFTTTIGVGNATPSASGAGITFPATQSASTDANTLDDYEEGTFTLTISSGSVTGLGSYIKIGKQVTVFVDLTAITGGGTQLSALPFLPAITTGIGIYTSGQAFAAGTTSPAFVIGGGNTVGYFRTVGSGVGFSTMPLTASAAISFEISYII